MMQSSIAVPFFPFETGTFERFWRRLWAPDLAIDLGTANTLIYLQAKGIVLNQPSMVACDRASGELVASGHAARELYGRSEARIRCMRPLKDGVVADFEMSAAMMRSFLADVMHRGLIRKPRIVIGVPSGITQVERGALIETVQACGAGAVYLVDEAMAAALGAGLAVERPLGNMVVDIGGGTTEVAVISLGASVYSHSIRVAGDEMDEAIQREIKRAFGLQVGALEAERIKMVLGSALPLGKKRSILASGRDLRSNMPQQVEIGDDLVRAALAEPIAAIVASIQAALENVAPELAQDILTRGVYLAGGGALLKGLSERLARETGIPFHRAQDPLTCVVRGVGMIVDDLTNKSRLCAS